MFWRQVLARAATSVAGAVLLAGTPLVTPGSAPEASGPTLVTPHVAPAVAVRSATPAADAASARAEAREAALEVSALTKALSRADRAYAAGVAAVGRSVTHSVVAHSMADAAERRAGSAAAAQARSARALYISGGQAGIVSSLLQAEDPQDLALRALVVRQTMESLRTTAEQARTQAASAAARARRAAAGADTSIVVADDLAQQSAEFDRLLRSAQARLDRLSARARRLADAERAARQLAKARAAAAARRQAALTKVRAPVPQSGYMALYRSAATTCPGMRWTLLAAVGQVESGHGRNVGPSSAGAIGPMQFMPATFRGFAVDGDADGDTDAMSPPDAIYTAAKYLCTGGAGSPSGVRQALFRYNRAQWYVDLVLRVEQRLVTRQP